VVRDEHEVAGLKGGVQSAGGIGHDQGADTQRLHDPDRENDLPGVVSFVQVKSSLENHGGMALKTPQEQSTPVAGNRRNRKMGDRAIVDGVVHGHGFKAAAESGAGQEADRRLNGAVLSQKGRRGIDVLLFDHRVGLLDGRGFQAGARQAEASLAYRPWRCAASRRASRMSRGVAVVFTTCCN
jgi:hypothetical protein